MKTVSLRKDSKRDYFVVAFPYDPQIVEAVRQIPQRKFEASTKCWIVPADHTVVNYMEVFSKYFEFETSQEVLDRIEQLKIPPSADVEIPSLKMSLRNFQRLGVSYAKRSERCFIADDMGLGKSQPLYSKILTPLGWKSMGEMEIGDEIINSDGGISHVTGTYTQGLQDVYEIEFNDGTTVHTCDRHLWAIQSATHKIRKNGFRIKELKDFKDDLSYVSGTRINSKWFIPMMRPAQLSSQEIFLDPYLMGALLGDGCFRGRVGLSSDDSGIVEQVRNLLPKESILKQTDAQNYVILKSTAMRNNVVIQELKRLGLYNHLSIQKFIPNVYKFNSIDNRIRLLQGLMDTDGYISSSGCIIEYYTSSEQMCEDVKFIVQSLGGNAKESHKLPQYVYNGKRKIGHKSYILRIKLPPDVMPFTLARKMNRLHNPQKYGPYRSFSTVKYIGKKETQCISTDSINQLYVTDGCVVTHNTCQSIATVESLNAYPSLVVCPASVKLNWQKEINMWTERLSTIISGEKSENSSYGGDFVIINYDILLHHQKMLESIGFKSIILDESHMVKGHKSQRTKSVKSIAKKIRYRFALTGTPVLNKPRELIAQLDILDRLDSMGGFWTFAKRYCDAKESDFGWDFSGHSNLEELHAKLSNTCYIRRMKSEVLDELPSKQRTYVPIEIDNPAEYKEVKKDFIKWVKNRLLSKKEFIEEITQEVEASPHLTKKQKKLLVEAKINLKLNKAKAAEAIIKIEYLKQVCARGKVKKFEEFIDNVLEQGNKLVVFAVHQEIQKALYAHYQNQNIARVFSEDDTTRRQENIDKFQNDPECKLMIASLGAGGIGITLTAASTVAFVEFGWNPAIHDQAEDRCHRIGQKDSVNCYYFYGEDTIDEDILELIESKRKVTQAVTDGKSMDAEQSDVEKILRKFI